MPRSAKKTFKRLTRTILSRVTYKASILPEHEPEECPPESIMRYWYDDYNWIDVTTDERGIEIRSVGAEMLITPLSGNTVQIFLRDRR